MPLPILILVVVVVAAVVIAVLIVWRRRSGAKAPSHDLSWLDEPAGGIPQRIAKRSERRAKRAERQAARARRKPPAATSRDFPVTVYLSDEAPHAAVEAAAVSTLEALGIEIEGRDDPVIGSWFRRFRARVTRFARSPAGKELTDAVVHALDSYVVLKRDAEIAALLSQNVGPIIASLQGTPDAIVRLGPLLLLKLNGVVVVHQLTAAQQLKLDHNADLLTSPHDIADVLGLADRGATDTSLGESET